MGRKSWLVCIMMVVMLAVSVLSGCGDDEPEVVDNDLPIVEDIGLLVFTADGEEHAREGTSSKDGWDITFDHVYVTLGNIIAYQTDPPFDTEQGWEIDYETIVELEGTYTVDLADPAADPAVVAEYDYAPSGRYNALSWDMLRAASGDFAGYAVVFVGTAEKEGQEIGFTIKLEQEVAYLGGEYVGDERKGILMAGDSAELEMTFHIDHLFGRADKDPDDPMNQDALGFDPLAAIAVDGVVDTDLAALAEALSEEDFAKLEAILLHFGHVGEGHALARPL